ncbi:major facilitator superfamily protein [Hirsutella rhossiliensis]|uniref:Major facilitator superfamily domain-containing protein n=1 Tax=Hirsutella rhossiliensis TaxID=111463 RepID=A0A9P8N6X6_9HYPO|nr:major facilitator superfamily domain-containing protein [Hirsutella rhossiliensis]KAH0967945.1 major facilitator superfamily domain-containing protein [Hirsutella rhossiliensis]
MAVAHTPPKGASIATLTIVCLVFFVDIANIGMANIALPTIQTQLGYDDGSLQWVLTAYALTFGGFLMAGGRLGDIFGHKHVLVFGMTLFNIATLVCGLVNHRIGLVVGRAFQGLAAAFTIPSAQSLVALSFQDPQARVKAFGAWGAAGSTGFVFGPIIGGLFTSLVSWEWIFWFSLIVEGALEIAALALLFTNGLPGPSPSQPDSPSPWSRLHIRLDVLGTFFSVSGLILLVYGLTTGNVHGWNKPDVIATLVVAVCLLAVFVFVELRVSSDPILPRYMFDDRVRVLGCVAAALTYAVWQGSNYLLTLQLQSFGFSALSTAVRFLPLGITAMVVNFVIPMLLRPVGSRNLLLASWALCIAGLVLLCRMASADDYWRLCLPGMILYIAGVGTVYFVGNVTVVATASEQLQGTVSGVYNMFLNVGGAVLGVAVLTVISDSVTSNRGGKQDPGALLDGYRAGYYGAIAMAALGLVLGVFFKPSRDNGEPRDGNGESPQPPGDAEAAQGQKA